MVGVITGGKRGKGWVSVNVRDARLGGEWQRQEGKGMIIR